ncbi:PR domain zinc finger protein 13 [Drosophila innubila]|uniref:PR domain zinc finger protein 13 n=1 Tax=Drosophila innubila TaxID=198719 RepID=UPI00148C3C45|nr:PR domain zinc finger protein 13 [Drosophila innubila]
MHTTAQLDNLELDESVNQAQPPKRGSGMIFRIEQLLPGSVMTTAPTTPTATTTTTTTTPVDMATITNRETTTKRMRGNLRPGVYTAQYTPKDTCSNVVPTAALLSCMTTPTPSDVRAHCALANGELAMSASLLRQIKLSEDIYSFNALFELQAGQLRIRLVRDVAREDEIVAWFGEELVLLMGIPFLTPLNIQGNSRYTCHLCHLTFETPHPLKIHLALSCGRSVMDLLWMRLHYALKTAARSAATTTIPPSPPLATSTSTSSASPTRTPPPPPSATSTRFSAFRPMASMQSLTLPIASSPPSTATLSYLPSMSMGAPLSSHPMNAAAQIEAIVSNMGASKQGHLCIYCGKVYSRKYGLKIHIRTHTGFKPLKCKFCLRPFGDPSNLNKHVRLHLQTPLPSGSESDINVDGDLEAGFQCQLCNKTFARSRDLQRHMETRHGGGTTAHPTTSTATTTTTGTAMSNQS